jgi:hypothetical protein
MKHMEKPTRRKPRSVLAGSKEYAKLLETQILELHDNIDLQQGKKRFTVEIDSSANNVQLISMKEAVSDPAEAVKLTIKLVDLGGHQEYFISSSLFVASTGIFMVCTDTSILREETVVSEYYKRIGTYIDLILQVAAGAGIQPKIVIVGTQMDK